MSSTTNYFQDLQARQSKKLEPKTPIRMKFRDVTNTVNNSHTTAQSQIKVNKPKPMIYRTPQKVKEPQNISPFKKSLFKHVCKFHSNKKAKYFVANKNDTQFCSECAIRFAQKYGANLKPINNQSNVSEFRPLEDESYLSNKTQQENSICRYNSDIQNFMIDLEQVVQSNSSALREIEQEKKTQKSNYETQIEQIEKIYKDTILWLQSEKNHIQKSLQNQYNQNDQRIQKYEATIKKNLKESKKFQQELNNQMVDIWEKEPSQHLEYYKSQVASMEDFLGKIQTTNFTIDKVRQNEVSNLFNTHKEHFYLIKNKNVLLSFDNSQNGGSFIENAEKNKSPQRLIKFSPMKRPATTILQPLIQVNQEQSQQIIVHSPVFKQI